MRYFILGLLLAAPVLAQQAPGDVYIEKRVGSDAVTIATLLNQLAAEQAEAARMRKAITDKLMEWAL